MLSQAQTGVLVEGQAGAVEYMPWFVAVSLLTRWEEDVSEAAVSDQDWQQKPRYERPQCGSDGKVKIPSFADEVNY